MKNYPKDKYISPADLLVDYTLYPDLKFYEVSGDNFKNKVDESIKIEKKDRFELNRVKIVTKLTLTLEAERILKNIYIKK